MNDNLIKQWKKDEKAIFKGWDFSYIKNRIIEQEPHWNYMNIAKNYANKSKSILDMATGGGERFAQLLKKYKGKSIAIEGYKPNVSVARKNLKKFNTKVFYADETKKLPFKDEQFDLVLNRHGGLNKNSAREIYRILKKGGIFLTQQVAYGNLADLLKEFGKKPKWPENILETRKKQLKNAGFKIIQAKKWKGKVIFKDVGAIVYWLKAIPWSVENFSVNKYQKVLLILQKKIDKLKKLSYTYKRFLIIARKLNENKEF